MAVVLTKPTRVYSADDLLCMPPDARYELIRGELIEMPPPPGGEHGDKGNRLGARVSVFVYDNDLGICFLAETGFKVAQNPDTVMAPDWAFVRKERLPEPTPKSHIPLAPDIVLETRSPGDSTREVAYKVEAWLAVGVKTVWVLDPGKKTLTIHRSNSVPQVLTEADTLSNEELLPGFELPLSRVFR